MHAGFKYLRNNLEFNYRAIYTPAPKAASSPECVAEVRRLLELWTKARTLTKEVLADEGDEGYLFGRYSIPDSFFWPPLCRSVYYTPGSWITEIYASLFFPPQIQNVQGRLRKNCTRSLD